MNCLCKNSAKKQDKLVDPNLVDAINKAIKLSVSEAEPEDIGGK